MTDPTAVPPVAEAPNRGPSRGGHRWLRATVIVGGLAGLVAWLLLGSEASEAFVYSKLVDEVVANPAAFAGKQLRVEGALRQGSIRFREEPCEWRFVLEKDSHSMPVSFPQCVVPDTFRDGMGIAVTVQGQIQPEGLFIASQVIPRCPSKYDASHRNSDGKAIPHTAGAPLPLSSAR